MTIEELREKVDFLVTVTWPDGDPESAHGEEDSILDALVHQFAPAEFVAEVDRLAKADFPRWMA